MSFHWPPAAAEMGFAAAVENLCFLPEWQNPLLMSTNTLQTCHDDTLLLLEALHVAHSSLLALRYVQPIPSIVSARLLGPEIQDEPPFLKVSTNQSCVLLRMTRQSNLHFPSSLVLLLLPCKKRLLKKEPVS
jgi:hypothetical protein